MPNDENVCKVITFPVSRVHYEHRQRQTHIDKLTALYVPEGLTDDVSVDRRLCSQLTEKDMKTLIHVYAYHMEYANSPERRTRYKARWAFVTLQYVERQKAFLEEAHRQKMAEYDKNIRDVTAVYMHAKASNGNPSDTGRLAAALKDFGQA